MILEKECFICKTKKPLSEFHKRMQSSDEHRNECKECRRTYNKKRNKNINNEPKLVLTDTQISWIAGLLEGEGCFDVNGTNPRIRLEMKDKDVVLKVHSLVGGRIFERNMKKYNEKYNNTLVLTLCKRNEAEPILRGILPWLGERRKQKVETLIEWYNQNPPKR